MNSPETIMVEGHAPDCTCIECRMERMEKQLEETGATMEMLLKLLKGRGTGKDKKDEGKKQD